MFLKLNKHSDVPIYRQVVDQLEHLILSGQLKQGAQLASVRDVSAEHKVNPMTISKAYSLLEQKGLLTRQKGIGLFVQFPDSEAARASKLSILEEQVGHTALCAVQLGIDLESVISVLKRLYEKYKTGA